MYSMFLSNYRNTCESLGELEKAVETLAAQHFSFSQSFRKCLSCVVMVTAYGAILRLLFQDQPHLICNILSRARLVNNGTIYQTK